MEGQFDQADLLSVLESMSHEAFDAFDFGLVKMDRGGQILAYNKYEAELSSNRQNEVLGKNFFTQVAPCTNNFMVAEKYKSDQTELDEFLDYVFTYRIKPTPVRLRLLTHKNSQHQYLAVQILK